MSMIDPTSVNACYVCTRDTEADQRILMWDRKAEFAYQDSIEAERAGLSFAAQGFASEAHRYSQYASAIEGEFDTRPATERIER
jgi:hypothetical protein